MTAQPELVERRRRPAARPRRRRGGVGLVLLLGIAAIAASQFTKPAPAAPTTPFVNLSTVLGPKLGLPAATPTADAFGRSGEVKVRFALPGDAVQFPLAIGGSPEAIQYQWVTVTDSVPVTEALPLSADPVIAPRVAGFYRLALVREGARHVVVEPTLAVMVPFDRKIGNWLNGYRIGTYLSERLGQPPRGAPLGFVEVTPQVLDLPVSTHLRLSDFVTHDDQDNVWPKYVALNPRLLDKLELIVADLGGAARPELSIDVHSGFRSPSHNRETRRAARDSRHQYGDAADVQIDANGDGKITMADELRVMRAVERVEAAHPDLVGGLGIYTSRRYRTPYLHIDARGKKSRWHG